MEKRDFQNWPKPELVKELKKMEKRKKYGIVWEDKPEEVAELCKTKLPILEEAKNKEIKTDESKPVNIMIEGDNYHALSVLNYTHKGKVDVIYIDPPYNTGNKDFKYNDIWIDNEDAYRHSKWLSFMNKRLKLAKNLLKNNGLIFISIDDNEMPQLKLLCDEILGEENFVNIIAMRVSPPNGVKITHATKTIIKEKEYVVVYAKNKKNIQLTPQFKRAEKWDSHFDKFIVKTGKNPEQWKVIPLKEKLESLNLKADLDDKKFMQWIRQNSDCIFQLVGLKKIQGIKKYEVEKIIPIEGSEGYFAFKGRQVQLLANSIKGTEQGETLSRLLCDLWVDISFNNLFQEGSVDFKFGKKPVSLIKRIVKLSTNNKNSMLLDFFAGSGSSGEAVMQLNKEDGGHRKYILCTNNEDNNGDGKKIAEDICYPRIKVATQKNGGGSLKYYKTDFVDAEPTDENKEKMVAKSTEMLCLKEGCFDEVKKGKDFKIFNNQGKYLGIIYTDDGIAPFQEAIRKLNKKASVYVFSLDESAREDEFKAVADLVELKPIPAVILNVYKRIFI